MSVGAESRTFRLKPSAYAHLWVHPDFHAWDVRVYPEAVDACLHALGVQHYVLPRNGLTCGALQVVRPLAPIPRPATPESGCERIAQHVLDRTVGPLVRTVLAPARRPPQHHPVRRATTGAAVPEVGVRRLKLRPPHCGWARSRSLPGAYQRMGGRSRQSSPRTLIPLETGFEKLPRLRTVGLLCIRNAAPPSLARALLFGAESGDPVFRQSVQEFKKNSIRPPEADHVLLVARDDLRL